MEFGIDDKKTFAEMLMPFKSAIARYWKISWAPAIAVTGIVLFLTIRLPDYYVADVGITIQSQNVNLGQMSRQEKEAQEERFETLIQEMLSRPRLRAICDKLNLYPDLKGVKGKESAIMRLRNSISIEPIIAASGKALSQTFRLSFVHSEAKKAYEVADQLSKLFLSEGNLAQMSRTRRTEEFFESKLREVRKKLEKMEKKREEFIKENSNQLPEYREEALARLTASQNQLLNNSQLIEANLKRREYLEKELSIINQSNVEVASSSGAVDIAGSPTSSLRQLKRALAVLSARYSAKHPDIIATKKRIAILEGQLKNGTAPKSVLSKNILMSDPTARRTRRELNELKLNTEAYIQENKKLKGLITALNKNIEMMPLRDQQLSKIVRDYEVTKERYSELVKQRQDAEMKSSIIITENGEKFEVFDPASYPFVPAGPKRELFALGSVGAALVVFFGLPIALYYLNGSYKGRDDAEKELGIPVVGIIPTLETAGVIAKRRRGMTTSLLASACTFVGGLAIIILLF
jgi:polysaccharide chain length determinant protein (PEP-CTERM system associated)